MRGGVVGAPVQVEHAARTVLAGVLFGIGTVAFVDEVVFHQLLHWHKFYDRSTTEVGLVSDGLFHALSWFATVASLFLVGSLREIGAFWPRAFLSGWLVGAGVFQLYDGVVHHKLLGLHQIRYGVDLLAYDLLWNATAVALLGAGTVGLVGIRRAVRASTSP